MLKKFGNRTAIFVVLVFSLCFTGLAALLLGFQEYKKIPLTGEKELKATIEGGLADIYVARGSASTILNAQMSSDEGDHPVGAVDYSERGGIGYVIVDLNPDTEERKHKSKRKKSLKISSSTWKLLYTDAIPISFDIELGLGEGEIDMSGLNVKDFDLSTGASSVKLAFNEPNQNTIQNLTIEAGLSKLRAIGLGNANFKRMHFEGGVGKYTLDFTGDLRREVDVDAEVGLGALTIIIPSNIGARIMYEKNWICELDIDREFDEIEDDVFQTDNYASARGKINLRVEAGFGTVRIRRD